jgi:hypothetical protein
MKINLLVIAILFSATVFAQLDTTYYFDGDFSLSINQDSCALKSKPANYHFNGIVALGNPLFLCDRIYFKKGVKFDQKKSFDFGFIYLQFDTTGLVRQHEFYDHIHQTHLNINISNIGHVFWSNFKSIHYTNYLLFNNGRFQEINTTLTNNKDSASVSILSILKKYTNNSIVNQWLNLNTNLKINFVVTFLPGGLINNFGYVYVLPNKPQIRFGKWTTYNLYCDCYQTKEYFSK